MTSLITQLSDIYKMFVFGCLLMVSSSVWAADTCPKGADPVYCQLAKDTGGKVFDGRSAKDWEDISKMIPRPVEPSPVHEYSPFSKDIGCEVFRDSRSREICDSISENLEWGWTGHATIAPGWKSNWNSVKNVYCDKKITKLDLPILEKMCGLKIKPHMSCMMSTDARLAIGVEYLIKMVIVENAASEELDNEFKGSVYDPKSKNYVLKDGCRK